MGDTVSDAGGGGSAAFKAARSSAARAQALAAAEIASGLARFPDSSHAPAPYCMDRQRDAYA